jgi:hypothetical protein
MGGRHSPRDGSHGAGSEEIDADDRLEQSRLLLETVWLGLKITLLIASILAMAFGLLSPEQVL